MIRNTIVEAFSFQKPKNHIVITVIEIITIIYYFDTIYYHISFLRHYNSTISRITEISPVHRLIKGKQMPER